MNITTIENKTVITLKEICDILEVRHNDAMTRVLKLSQEPSFGQLRENSICIPKGNGATQTIKTYSLTKMQAIAVGARLNNALLMKLVMKLEEAKTLTVPQTYIEALTEVLRLAKDNEMLQIERDKAVKTNTILTHVKKVYTATEVAKELGLRSATKLNNTLKEIGIQYKTNNTWMFYAKHSDLGYESIKQTVLDNGKVIYSRYFTQIGREFILRCVTDYLVTID
tara:strand:+ start:1231 stop:1905 length:675 start_codon:yes stop_codon:yes gene_type:complete